MGGRISSSFLKKKKNVNICFEKKKIIEILNEI